MSSSKKNTVNINVLIEAATKLAGPGRLFPEGEKFLKETLWELRKLEDRLLKTGLTPKQYNLLGAMRLQRQLLWMLIPETTPADAT